MTHTFDTIGRVETLHQDVLHCSPRLIVNRYRLDLLAKICLADREALFAYIFFTDLRLARDGDAKDGLLNG